MNKGLYAVRCYSKIDALRIGYTLIDSAALAAKSRDQGGDGHALVAYRLVTPDRANLYKAVSNRATPLSDFGTLSLVLTTSTSLWVQRGFQC